MNGRGQKREWDGLITPPPLWSSILGATVCFLPSNGYGLEKLDLSELDYMVFISPSVSKPSTQMVYKKYIYYYIPSLAKFDTVW